MNKKKKNDAKDEFSQKIPRTCPLCQNKDFRWERLRDGDYGLKLYIEDNHDVSLLQQFKQ